MPQLSSNLPWELANNQWAQSINPLLANPRASGRIIKNVSLTTGTNIIAHGLGRTMQGWNVVDIDAAITYYRSAPLNPVNLVLTCSGPATITLEVF